MAAVCNSSRVGCAVLALVVSLAPAPGVALPRGAASAAAQPSQAPAPVAAVLSSSEISVVESGGIAGRVHSVRLVAANGRVGVEYRAREAPATARPFTGTLDQERYVALWRQLEESSVWSTRSPARTRGADLVQVELRVRLGETVHLVRWDEASQQTPGIRDLPETARRALAAGRESAFTR